MAAASEAVCTETTESSELRHDEDKVQQGLGCVSLVGSAAAGASREHQLRELWQSLALSFRHQRSIVSRQ
jgi:hypothetical protein